MGVHRPHDQPQTVRHRRAHEGVPFVFLTGYGDAAMMPIEFRSEAAVLLRDHAVQHRNREHGVDARGHAGQLRRSSLLFGCVGIEWALPLIGDGSPVRSGADRGSAKRCATLSEE